MANTPHSKTPSAPTATSSTTPAPSPVRRPDARAIRTIFIAVVCWALGSLAIFPLSHGSLPFHIKAFEAKGQPFLGPILAGEGSLAVALLIMGLAIVLTLHRKAPDLAARAPALPVARIETLGMLAYGIAGQAGGYFLGHAVGHYAISLHMPGTLYGLSGPYTPREAIIWAIYNFVIYAVIPFTYFRWRGYTCEQLSLTSTNLRADLLLILAVFIVESTVELVSVSSAIFSLGSRQLLLGIPLAFTLNFFGTVLPVMIFIYAILLPRYLKLTGSIVTTVMLGGLTYAAVHCFESWSDYSTLTNGLLSILFITLQYVGPGMVKAVLTLRTGNAWVHAWAYHAFEPHVLIDTPTIVEIFHIL